MTEIPHSAQVPALVEGLFRERYGRLVAGLVRVLGTRHFDLAEDVVQDALSRALRTWPFDGVPADPSAWLLRVARNLALDRLRSGAVAERKAEDLARWATSTAEAAPESARAEEAPEDDRLRLVFTCCHPVLAIEARVTLTLKTVLGFGVPEIARALLANETAIAQRVVRAKRRLQDEDVAFEVPVGPELALRLDAVLEVVYLLFNEGFSAHRGTQLVRTELASEAIRLGELLVADPATNSPRVHALLALMYLQASRLPARTDEAGDVATLAQQDRRLWDRERIARGMVHFERSIAGDELTPWHVEAAIASIHAIAPSYAATDWRMILSHYDVLVALNPSPVVRLNRAVAVAHVHGEEAALSDLDPLQGAGELVDYPLLFATRALCLWRLGRHEAAAEAFRAALARPMTDPERRLLERRLARCLAGELESGTW